MLSSSGPAVNRLWKLWNDELELEDGQSFDQTQASSGPIS